MAFRDGPLQDGRTPLVWTAVAATAVALIVAVGLLLSDKRTEMARNGQYGAARNEFDSLAAPVMGVLSAPIRLLTDASTDVRGYFFAVSENRRLRARLKEMERWRDAAIALKNVNDRYEQLLRLRTEPPIPMISARVIADARGPFSNARLADAGANQGVRDGQPVLSEHGVVGRVVGAGAEVSRVLLLTDVDSRTPVLTDRTNARAILTGDGGPNPRLEYLRGSQPLKDGDILLTSGDGGVYPRGLPVGVAAKDGRGVWRARLYADRQALDYVRILTYVDFGKLAEAQRIAAAQTPPPLDPQQQAQLQAALAARTAPPPGAAASPIPVPAAAAPAPAAAAAPVVRPTLPAPRPAPAATLRTPSQTPSAPLRSAPATPVGATLRPPSATPATRPPRRAPAATTSAAGAARRAAPTASPASGATRPATSRPAVARRPATSAPAGETAEQRARRLRLRTLTQDAARPRATMRPIPDPQELDL